MADSRFWRSKESALTFFEASATLSVPVKHFFEVLYVIKSNIINWALTNQGERPMRPYYGANLRANIFEALNEGTFDILEEKLKLGMSTNFPNVIILEMQVQQNEQEYSIGITIKY